MAKKPPKKTIHRQKTTADNPEHKQELLDIWARELPPIIARKAAEHHLGGVVTRKTLANADARGEGPLDAFAVGQHIVYRRESLLDYISRNFTVLRLENPQTLKSL